MRCNIQEIILLQSFVFLPGCGEEEQECGAMHGSAGGALAAQGSTVRRSSPSSARTTCMHRRHHPETFASRISACIKKGAKTNSEVN
jgi:hypothetical protein